MTTLEVLRAARAHLSDPARWYRGDFCESDWDGPKGQAPCCALGAVGLFACGKGSAYEALQAVLPEPRGSVTFYNDAPSTTHADILALYDRAIAAEEARQ
ncbi:DUF6197 family protein [Dinoroseobacter sp. S124A]|uniref:DUF6197 family protein n=1 Tax=Dinoroseobacter sp. S124A TaxID=3415128 RepID=UPI003C7C7005